MQAVHNLFKSVQKAHKLNDCINEHIKAQSAPQFDLYAKPYTTALYRNRLGFTGWSLLEAFFILY